MIGVTNGVFDLFHTDHKSFIDKCKSQCDYLIVYIDSDEFVKENKSKYPLLDFITRKKALISYGVNEVKECYSWNQPFEQDFDLFFFGSDQLQYPEWQNHINNLNLLNKVKIIESGEVHSRDLRKLIEPRLCDPNPEGLEKIISTLEENNIVYCAMFGTLLGIMRNNKKIPWDKDYDLIVFDIDYRDLVKKLSSFEVGRETKFTQIFFPPKIKGVQTCFVDLFKYEKSKSIAHFIEYPIFYDDIFPLKDSNIDGVKIKIPNNSMKILNSHYPNWQTNFHIWFSWHPKHGSIMC
jgi:cytidyltransferase-like protein